LLGLFAALVKVTRLRRLSYTEKYIARAVRTTGKVERVAGTDGGFLSVGLAIL